jgi:hypothetical protein
MAFNVAHAPTRHTSFWGECTATLDWCEENYHLTPFIAEFCKFIAIIMRILRILRITLIHTQGIQLVILGTL